MRYPFVWKLQTLTAWQNGVAQAREEWTWEWVETPGMPSIAEVEQMLRAHRQQLAADAAAAQSAERSQHAIVPDGPAAFAHEPPAEPEA